MTRESFGVKSSGALFVRVLGRIMREKLAIRFSTHEHWDFEHNAEFTTPDGLVYEMEHSRYIGMGAAKTYGLNSSNRLEVAPLEMRVYIERSNWTALPSHGSELWTFHWWGKTPSVLMDPVSCRYFMPDDDLTVIDEIPKRIPTKIEQWCRALPH